MREVNNNPALNFRGVQPIGKVEEEKCETLAEQQTTEITDLSKMPSEVIGRSQVAPTALEKDLKFMDENITKVENANKLTEKLLDQGMPYEEAVALSGRYVEEF